MTNKNCSAIIPARLNSTRLPQKLLADLCGKSVIQRVYENALNSNVFKNVYVATDSEEIEKECHRFNCPVLKTRSNHQSGTSRISEACLNIDADIIVNIQGDEPFIKKEPLINLIEQLTLEPDAQIATLIVHSGNLELSKDPGNVKVVIDQNHFALYFSRLPIPFYRNSDAMKSGWFHHIGIYAFKKNFLLNYSNLKPCMLESAEKLEQLGFISNGYKILTVETDTPTIGIDTKQDLEHAVSIIKNQE